MIEVYITQIFKYLLTYLRLTSLIYNCKLSLYLYQSRVPSIVQILKNALFPITTKRSWSTLVTWGTLTSTSTCITLVSRRTS